MNTSHAELQELEDAVTQSVEVTIKQINEKTNTRRVPTTLKRGSHAAFSAKAAASDWFEELQLQTRPDWDSPHNDLSSYERDPLKVPVQNYILELECLVRQQQGQIDLLYRQNQAVVAAKVNCTHRLRCYEDFLSEWPMCFLEDWPRHLRHTMMACGDWAAFNCITGKNGRNKHKDLPEEAKKEIMSSLKGWVRHDNLDELVSRIPPNFRYCILRYFAEMIMLKEILERFFTDPFWYMEGLEGEKFRDCKETETGISPRVYLDSLYKRFAKAEKEIAHHWRSMTARLLNVPHHGYFERDPALGLELKERIKAKARAIAEARLSDKTFALLLTETAKDNQNVFCCIYEEAAVLAMHMSTEMSVLEWRTYEDGPGEHLQALPPKFFRRSKDLDAAHAHGIWENGARLDQHQVVALLSPQFLRRGGWFSTGKAEVILKAVAIVDDPIGLPGDWHASDEEAQRNWDKKQPRRKKAKIEKEVVDTSNPPPEPSKGKEASKKKKKRGTRTKS